MGLSASKTPSFVARQSLEPSSAYLFQGASTSESLLYALANSVIQYTQYSGAKQTRGPRAVLNKARDVWKLRGQIDIIILKTSLQVKLIYNPLLNLGKVLGISLTLENSPKLRDPRGSELLKSSPKQSDDYVKLQQGAWLLVCLLKLCQNGAFYVLALSLSFNDLSVSSSELFPW